MALILLERLTRMPDDRSTRRRFLRLSGGLVGLSAIIGHSKIAAFLTNASKPDSKRGPIHEGYETTRVEAVSSGGDQLGVVTAAIAKTPQQQYRGLSDTGVLPSDQGMLFAFDEVADRTFVMRRMSFSIDIIFVDSDGEITQIHHAARPAPNEDGSQQQYEGRAQYVLEVVKGWTTKRDVQTGDLLEFSL